MCDQVLDSDVEEIGARLREVAAELAGRTVLITGAGGFLGRYLIATCVWLNEHVLDRPVQVIAVDNLITSGTTLEERQWPPNVHLMTHDVIKPLQWDGPLHYIVHAAGIASPYYYRAFPLETLEVATTGTRNMLELARSRGARLTFFSSSEIYGDPDPRHVPIQESYRGNVSCQGPRACYDESKRTGETLCYIYHQQFGVHTNTIRPFNVFGPGMQESDYRVMPNFASRIKGRLPLQVYGAGTQRRTYCYVVDAIDGFFRVMLRGVPGEAYNIGNPTPEVAVMELAERMRSVSGVEVDVNLVEYPDSYPADEPRRRCPDVRKARLQLGFEARIALDEGLRRYLRWSEGVYTGVQ